MSSDAWPRSDSTEPSKQGNIHSMDMSRVENALPVTDSDSTSARALGRQIALIETSAYIRLAAITTALIAIAVLTGWAFDIRALKSILPDYITMRINTALCFLLMASALILEQKRGARSRSALACASIAGAIALLTLAQYLFDVNLGIDELFLLDPGGAGRRGLVAHFCALVCDQGT